MTRFILPLRWSVLLLIWGWVSWQPVIGQAFKSYIGLESFENALLFSANEVIAVPESGDLAFIGEVKAAAPQYTAMGYLIRTDSKGVPQFSTSIRTNLANSLNGVRATTLAMDDRNQYYIGGSSVQNYMGNSAGSERTFTGLDGDGKVVFSHMQPNHNFESAIFDLGRRRLAVLSNNIGNSNPNTDLMISFIEEDGTYSANLNIETPTRDSAVKIIQMPDGYLTLGVSDVGQQKQILLTYISHDMDILWSRQLSNVQFEHQVADIAYDGEQSIVVVGTSTEVGTQDHYAFAAGITLDGEVQFYNRYYFQSGQEVFGTGVAAITVGSEAGYLLSGYFQPQGTTDKRAYVIKLDREGTTVWANNYSNFSRYTDFTYAEAFNDITFLPDRRAFVAVGGFTRFLNGNIYEQSAVMVQAGLDRGNVDDTDIGCSVGIEVRTETSQLDVNNLGGAYKDPGGVVPFRYLVSQPAATHYYCSGTIMPRAKQSLLLDNVKLRMDYTDPKSPVIRYVWDPALGDGMVELIDIQGRTIGVVGLSHVEQSQVLNVENLSAGVYFLKLKLAGTYVGMEKILVQP